jgi:hypothetical protein
MNRSRPGPSDLNDAQDKLIPCLIDVEQRALHVSRRQDPRALKRLQRVKYGIKSLLLQVEMERSRPAFSSRIDTQDECMTCLMDVQQRSIQVSGRQKPRALSDCSE